MSPPLEVFTAYDRFKTAARNAGVRVNVTKTVVQQPTGEPTRTTCWLAAERGLRLVCGNSEYLGGAVGLDDDAMSAWVGEKLLRLTPLKKAIADIDCPSILSTSQRLTCYLSPHTYYVLCPFASVLLLFLLLLLSMSLLSCLDKAYLLHFLPRHKSHSLSQEEMEALVFGLLRYLRLLPSGLLLLLRLWTSNTSLMLIPLSRLSLTGTAAILSWLLVVS